MNRGRSKRSGLAAGKALVAFGGRNVGETQLTDALWSDAEGDDARHSLKTTVHRLRKLLGNELALQVESGKLSFDPGHCWTDVWAFERLLDSDDPARKVVDDLLLARIEIKHIHVIAKQETPLEDLPEASPAQASDWMQHFHRLFQVPFAA